MSDLHCAVRVVVVPSGALPDVDALRRERPVLLRAGSADAAEAAAARELAEALDIPVRRLADDGEPIAARHVTAALGDLADEYRGECVLVVVPAEAFAELAGQVLPAGSEATGAAVRADADGHHWATWGSAPPQ